MSDGTKIEWTDATWNVVNGCSVVSPGCTNCYAMRLAGTRMRHHPSRQGLTVPSKAGPVWNGTVRFNEKVLLDPIRWKRPRKIFVCAHGDLFHHAVPEGTIDRVFAVMALAPQHIFQVLTKRPDRMLNYLKSEGVVRRIYSRAHATRFLGAAPDPNRRSRAFRAFMSQSARDVAWTVPGGCAADEFARREPDREFPTWVRWPLPNVWLGTSAEDQRRFDQRVAALYNCPAALRWFSFEPLLGPIDARGPLSTGHFHWAVLGGESGSGARPMHPDWARSLRDQCAAAGVPFLFKQWGCWAPVGRLQDDAGDTDETIAAERVMIEAMRDLSDGGLWIDAQRVQLVDSGMYNWANEEAQPPSDALVIQRVGKRAAGRLLDGVEHNGYPA